MRLLKHRHKLHRYHELHLISITQSTIRISFHHGQVAREEDNLRLGDGGRGSKIEAKEEVPGDRNKEDASNRNIKSGRCSKSPPKALPKAVARTPTKEGKKVASSQTTPSIVSSKSTTQSKRAVTLMSGLALKSPSTPKRTKNEDVEEASLSNTVDYEDPNTVLGLTKQGVVDTLGYHFPEREDYIKLEYYEQILLLVKAFKPADIRFVLQGLLTDEGKDWRKLKLNKLRRTNILAPEFAKVCVELFNAETELNTSTSVPEDIVIDHGKGQKKVPSQVNIFLFYLQNVKNIF